MAITLVSELQERQGLRDCTRYIFNMTDLIAGTITRRFGYQLWDVTNSVYLTQEESLTPIEGVDFKLDFKEEIKRSLSTKPPLVVESPINQSEEGFYIEIELEYWIIAYDSSNCSTIPKTKNKTTTTRVYNTGLYNMDFNTNRLLSVKAPMINVCTNHVDVFTFSKVSIGSTIMHVSSVINGSKTTEEITIESGVKTYVCGVANMYPNGIPEGLDEIIINVDGNQWIYIIRCCYDKSATLFFQTQKGGYSSLSMGVLKIAPLTKRSTAFRPVESCIPENDLNGGLATINNTSYFEYTLEYEIEDYDDAFYKSLVTAGVYFLHVDGEIHRFIVTSNNTPIFEENKYTTITIKGYVNYAYPIPSYR